MVVLQMLQERSLYLLVKCQDLFGRHCTMIQLAVFKLMFLVSYQFHRPSEYGSLLNLFLELPLVLNSEPPVDFHGNVMLN